MLFLCWRRDRQTFGCGDAAFANEGRTPTNALNDGVEIRFNPDDAPRAVGVAIVSEIVGGIGKPHPNS